MSTRVRQVTDHRWPSGGDQPIAELRFPLDRLAARSGLVLEQWEEEGLGPTRGAWCRLPSGRVVQVYERQYALGGAGSERLGVSADLGDVSKVGSAGLVDEVLTAFELDGGAVAWKQDAGADQWLRERIGTPPSRPAPRGFWSGVRSVAASLLRHLSAPHRAPK